MCPKNDIFQQFLAVLSQGSIDCMFFSLPEPFGTILLKLPLKKKRKKKNWNFSHFSPLRSKYFCLRLKSSQPGLPELFRMTKHDNFRLIFHYQTVSEQKNILPEVYIFFWNFKPQTVLSSNGADRNMQWKF